MKTLADIVEEFANSKEGQKLKRQMQAKKKKSPARFERQYDFELIQMHTAADANFFCAMQRFQALNDMRKEYERTYEMHEDFDTLYKEYHQYLLDSADYVRKLHERQKVLDQAVIDEDNNK